MGVSSGGGGVIVTFGEWLLARGSGLARVPAAAERDAPPAGARGPWKQEWRLVAAASWRDGYHVPAWRSAWVDKRPSSPLVIESRWVSAPVKEAGR